jgi:hypothetical protein
MNASKRKHYGGQIRDSLYKREEARNTIREAENEKTV